LLGGCRDQTEILFVLSAYRFDALGEYDKTFDSLYELTTDELLADHPKGEGLQTAIKNFQAALAKAEEKIRDENLKNRNVPYGVLCAALRAGSHRHPCLPHHAPVAVALDQGLLTVSRAVLHPVPVHPTVSDGFVGRISRHSHSARGSIS